jgi:hypothetical protein
VTSIDDGACLAGCQPMRACGLICTVLSAALGLVPYWSGWYVRQRHGWSGCRAAVRQCHMLCRFDLPISVSVVNDTEQVEHYLATCQVMLYLLGIIDQARTANIRSEWRLTEWTGSSGGRKHPHIRTMYLDQAGGRQMQVNDAHAKIAVTGMAVVPHFWLPFR